MPAIQKNQAIFDKMGSESPHHLPTLFFLFIIISIINSCYAAKPLPSSSAYSCPSFDCGNGLKIGYPFWKQSQQSEHCGYQGFDLSCKDNEPIIRLSNNMYKVKSFNNSEKTLTITYTDDLSDPRCPVAPYNVVLDPSNLLMNYTHDDRMIRFFYNCSLYPPSVQDIKCLQFGSAKRSFVFLDGAIPEFDWKKYCESILKVTALQSKVDFGGDLLVKGFGRALLEGFKLTWKPVVACQSCETTGGFCGHKAATGYGDKLFCFCSDGQHPFHCHDAGTIYGSHETNYAATGAVVFGGLVLVSTIVYHVLRWNFGGGSWMHNYVLKFHRLNG